MLLDHTAQEKPATFQHIEIIADSWMLNATKPIVINWEVADLESYEKTNGSFQFMCIANIPNKGYFDFGFSIGNGIIKTPWKKEIALGDGANATYKYTAIFDPASTHGALWINGKLVSEGKVKNNPNRQKSYFSVGDGSSGVSGKVKFGGISVKVVND